MAAGFIKGVIGMGLPTVAMGLLSLGMVPADAAVLLIVPSLVTNVWQLVTGPSLVQITHRLATMLLAVCAGTVLGISILTSTSAALASVALGGILAAYGCLGLTAWRFSVPVRAEPWLSPGAGFLTGIVTGATGVFVIPAVPYLHALGLPKEELIQALGLSFTVSTLALADALILSGQYPAVAAWSSLLAVIPALAGMAIGQHIRTMLEPELFRRWFCIGLVVLGGAMLVRALIRA